MATSAADRKAALQKQIEALQQQILDLNQAEIHELKLRLSDAKKVVRDYELQLEELTGKPAGTPRQRRERRPSIGDEALQDQILRVIANHGKEGLNSVQLAEKLNQDAIRVRKFIKDHPEVLDRQGSGPSTRFFLR